MCLPSKTRVGYDHILCLLDVASGEVVSFQPRATKPAEKHGYENRT